MYVSLIVAMSENRAIGLDQKIPWHIPADLRLFKAYTLGHHVIMGRKTHHSIGRPLPGRLNVVISRNAELVIPGCDVVHSLQDALALAASRSETEAFVIGGGTLYQQSLPFADRIYLTLVHATVAGDTFMPEFDENAFEVIESFIHPKDEKNQYSFTFKYLQRKGLHSPTMSGDQEE